MTDELQRASFCLIGVYRTFQLRGRRPVSLSLSVPSSDLTSSSSVFLRLRPRTRRRDYETMSRARHRRQGPRVADEAVLKGTASSRASRERGIYYVLGPTGPSVQYVTSTGNEKRRERRRRKNVSGATEPRSRVIR